MSLSVIGGVLHLLVLYILLECTKCVSWCNMCLPLCRPSALVMRTHSTCTRKELVKNCPILNMLCDIEIDEKQGFYRIFLMASFTSSLLGLSVLDLFSNGISLVVNIMYSEFSLPLYNNKRDQFLCSEMYQFGT